MRSSFKFEGFKELSAAFDQLSKATGKAVMRRAVKKAAEPFRLTAIDLAPVDQGDLRNSIIVSTRLSRSQQREARREQKSYVEVHFGPSSDGSTGVLNYATQVEFGTQHAGPQPYMRPAWDQNFDKALPIMAEELKVEIGKAAQRAARKSARLR